MVTAPSGVQVDLLKMVHSSHRPFCHSSEPQVSTVHIPVPDQQAWKIDALNINWFGLIANIYPPMALLHKMIWKICQCNPDSPRLARDALVLGPSATLNVNPTPIIGVNNTPQTHNHNNSLYLNLHAWLLGVNSSKNKSSLWKWQRELLPLKGHEQGQSTNQSGP